MENITSKGTIFGTLIAQAGPKGDTGKTGDRGLTGEAGYSPIKGVDYFTQEDISEIRKGIEGDLTGEYNKNAIEKTNIFNTNAKETTTSFDLNAENKTKEYNDNALAEIEKYNSNAIEKSNNFDTNFENKTSKFDSNCDEKTKEFNDNNDLGIQNYNNNAKKQMEIFDTNFTEKLEAFNNNAGNKFNGFNTNSDKALAEYNKNHTAKMKEFDDNYDTKTKTFDDNASAKLDEYNKNTELKEKSFNDNAGTKTETFNTNAEQKETELEELAEEKINEYNQVSAELTAKVEQVQAENEILKAENKLIKEQIPSASASGNSIHVEDSGSLDFDWKINGGHAQAITTQPENYIDDREARGKTILEATSLYLPIMNLKAGNGYYFKIFDNNNKIQNDSRYLAVDFYDENKVKIGSGPLGFPVDFTEEMATKVKYAKIYYNGNDTDKVIGNTVIKKIGLKITSSASADDIDMFVPNSPSPNYLSEVETAGSNVNEFDFKVFLEQTKNLALRRCTATLLENGFRLTKTENDCYIGENRLTSGYRVKVLPNITYTISTSSIFPKCYINFLKNDNTFISTVTIKPNAKSQTFITTSDTEYLTFRFGYNTDAEYFDFVHIKLEKGSVATPYSPYRNG